MAMAARLAASLAVALAGCAVAQDANAACDYTTITQETAVVEQTCCAGETCNGGLPSECSHNCADVFTPL